MYLVKNYLETKSVYMKIWQLTRDVDSFSCKSPGRRDHLESEILSVQLLYHAFSGTKLMLGVGMAQPCTA
jgi:hypothetical protein